MPDACIRPQPLLMPEPVHACHSGLELPGGAGHVCDREQTAKMKKRLSFENWSWLRSKGWLTAHEVEAGKEPDPKRARWGDLLRADDGSLDIYSFQLAVFSLLVGLSLLTSDLDSMATFGIPKNLLALLGLSNVVYIGGKAVAPSSFAELDEKVRALREAERDWLAKIAKDMTSLNNQQAKLQAAITRAPEPYARHIVAAREAARMLTSLYGTEDTKFKSEPIPDEKLLPIFP